MGRAFSARIGAHLLSYGVAIGWYGDAPLALPCVSCAVVSAPHVNGYWSGLWRCDAVHIPPRLGLRTHLNGTPPQKAARTLQARVRIFSIGRPTFCTRVGGLARHWGS